ncbi:hypothetical protein SAMCCGM7_pB0254 (plasmid) [Sinorhizobium americanum CCGM7]|nr:hypothetical protein SAMCCGM7_pB0254 [Sinorhizobium americanum CCGM7]
MSLKSVVIVMAASSRRAVQGGRGYGTAGRVCAERQRLLKRQFADRLRVRRRVEQR